MPHFLSLRVNDVFCIFLIFHILTASVPYLGEENFERYGIQTYLSKKCTALKNWGDWMEKVRLNIRILDIFLQFSLQCQSKDILKYKF